jgi:predicted dehydrogenase
MSPTWADASNVSITGTTGALRITKAQGFQNVEVNLVLAIRNDTEGFVALPTPAAYKSLPVSHLDASTQDVAYLYEANACDRATGSADAGTFEDAVLQHRLLDRLKNASWECALVKVCG